MLVVFPKIVHKELRKEVSGCGIENRIGVWLKHQLRLFGLGIQECCLEVELRSFPNKKTRRAEDSILKAYRKCMVEQFNAARLPSKSIWGRLHTQHWDMWYEPDYDQFPWVTRSQTSHLQQCSPVSAPYVAVAFPIKVVSLDIAVKHMGVVIQILTNFPSDMG